MRVDLSGAHSVMFEITLHLTTIWTQLYVNVHSINVSTTFEFIHHLFSFSITYTNVLYLLECMEIIASI